MKKLFSIFILASIMLSSCEFDDGDNRSIPMQPTLGTANIAIVYGATEAHDEVVDIYVDNEVLLTAEFGATTDGYVRHKFPQGTIIRVVRAGEFPTFGESAALRNVFLSQTAGAMLPADHNDGLRGQLKQNGNYSLFIGEEFGFMTPIFIEDDLTPPTAGNAKVRFVNLSWETGDGNGGPVDFSTTAQGVMATLNFYDNPVSDFINVPAGAFDASIFDEGTTDLVYDIPSVTLEAGGIYTIVLLGRDEPGDPEAYTHIVFENN